MDTTVKTRMAPSPTGEFHIGGLRTLLYNYAWAKKNKGKFLLRIEDTDRNRFVAGASDRIMEVVKDFNLSWDEGPFYQSERLNIYQEYIQRLVSENKAYFCFCEESRLDELRKKAQDNNQTFRYDKRCLSLNQNEVKKKIDDGEKYVVRLNVPQSGEVNFYDLVLGELSFKLSEIDDAVLIKSDGYPTYHFAVVVDDYLMGINYVIRGREWLSSTPKHVLLYDFFGFKRPNFAHLPVLKGMGSNKKLSKRDGSVFAIDFLRNGYLPEAILNYIMFLGWNPGTEKEIYNLEDFINDFSLERVQTAEMSTFDTEKLDWYSSQYFIKMSNIDFLNSLKDWKNKFNQVCLIDELEKKYSQEKVLLIIQQIKDRVVVFKEFDDYIKYFLSEPLLDSTILGKYSNKSKEVLIFFKDLLNGVQSEDFNFEYLNEYLHNEVKLNNFNMKEYFMTLRIAITGEVVTPPIIDIINILGKEESLDRLDIAISKL
jgi:glutamyl-tRNA synthetase